jgi:hypothetical protein
MRLINKTCLLAAISFMSAGSAFSQQQACRDVVSAGGQPSTPPYVLVNKCTGQTWQLVRSQGLDENGTVQPNQWTSTWKPIITPSIHSQPWFVPAALTRADLVRIIARAIRRGTFNIVDEAKAEAVADTVLLDLKSAGVRISRDP